MQAAMYNQLQEIRIIQLRLHPKNHTVMKTNRLIHICGTIFKFESIIPLDSVIIPGTYVAEANLPYTGYYGNSPERARPNSVFLFTRHYYSLEEVLQFSLKTDFCLIKEADLAPAVFYVDGKQQPAIRVKNFPDYQHLRDLQHCLAEQGVEFRKKTEISGVALVRIQKCFVLEEMENGIFLDRKEENKGYVKLHRPISNDEFYSEIRKLRNNSNCKTFDAAKASLIMNASVADYIRVYSEKIDVALLRCIGSQFEKQVKLLAISAPS